MRTILLFGSLIGLIQTATALVIWGCGLHSAPETLEGAHRFESIAAFIAIMASLSFGLRSVRRGLLAVGKPFTFGTGAKHTLGIVTLGALLTGIGQYLYVAVINPAYSAHVRAALVAAAKLSPEQAAAYESQLGFAASPAFRALSLGGTTFFFGLFIGLAYAFLFRERSSNATAAGAGS